MIKYNAKNINDWNFGNDNIAKVYYGVTSGSTSRLPEGYTELEYVQCGGGTTNTNGGFQLLSNVTTDYYFEVESQLINASNSPNIVSEKSSVEIVGYQMGLCYYKNSRLYLDYGGGRLSTNIRFDAQKEKHIYAAGHISGSSYTNLIGVKVDGVVQNTTNATTRVEGLPYLVGNLQYTGHTSSDVGTNNTNNAIMNIYSVKIYTNYGDTLVGDYIPVIDNNNIVTLYDRVSGNNAIPYGTLTAGSAVTPSSTTVGNVVYQKMTNGVQPTPPSSDSVIEYTASSKLSETTTFSSAGLHTYAFSGTSGQLTITSHTFSNGVGTIAFNGDVKRVGTYAFYKCSGATSITIPSSVSAFDNQPFWGCTSLTDITIKATIAPTFNDLVFDNTNNCNINVPCNSLVDYASDSIFFNYDWISRLKGISPCTNKVRYNDSGTTCHDYDLYQVVALQSSTDNGSTWSYVSPVVTQEYILEENSSDCGYIPPTPSGSGNVITYEALNEINFDEFGFEDEFGNVLNVESHTFEGNQGTIIFDGNIASIGVYSFSNCHTLTSIDIPSGVRSIRDKALSDCSNLMSVIVNATIPPTLSEGVFDDTPISNGDGYIYVPDESVMDYKMEWNDYSSQIQAIP